MKFLHAVKRRYGLASRRMSVRTQVAWHWRGLFMVATLAAGIGLVWWMHVSAGLYVGFDRGVASQELARLRGEIEQLQTENGRLRTLQVKNERYTQIDNVVQLDQQRELKLLRDENAQLKEELAFFRGMMSGDHGAGVNIYRFSVERGSAGTYRYQLMLVQAGQKEQVFQGHLQLIVTVLDKGRKNVLAFPPKPASDPRFSFALKSYQKLEGELPLSPEWVVRSVEARVFGEGSVQPKLSKTVNLQ